MKAKILGMTLLILYVCQAQAEGYVGIDYRYLEMKGNKKHSYKLNEAFPKNFNALDLYLGNYFEENLSYEIGYSHVFKSTKEYTFNTNESFISLLRAAGDKTTISFKKSSLFGAFNGYIPVSTNYFLMGQVGISVTRLSGTGSFVSSTGEKIGLNIKTKYSFLPRVGFGITGKFYKTFEGRVLASYEFGRLMRSKLNDTDGVRYTINPYSNGYSISLGLAFNY